MAFQGNLGLRSGGEVIDYQPWMIDEILKCSEDLLYFCETYVYINTKDEGIIKFPVRDYQKSLLELFDNERMSIVIAGRQLGKSLCSLAYMLWYALFNQDKTVAILANKLDLAKEQLENLKSIYTYLPTWMQPGVESWAKTRIKFSNGTKIICAATSPDGIRGMAINLLYLDEFAFVQPHIAERFVASVFPTISSGNTTKLIITSCVTKDTYIYTSDGITQISDYIDTNKLGGYETKPYKVLGMTGENSGSIMHNNGLTDTLIINTSYSSLECSKIHKLWACKDGNYGWFKAEELTSNDYISIKYGMNVWGNYEDINFIPPKSNHHQNYFSINKLTEDFCYFLGLFLAEGYARKAYNKTGKLISGQITITCGDDISSLLRKLGLKYGCYDDIHYSINSLSLLLILEHLGFDISKKAPKKIIPKQLLKISKLNMKALLQGLFDGDGHSVKGSKGRIGIGLSSPEMIKQIGIILNNFGILTVFSKGITKPTKKVKVSSNFYRLDMSGNMAIEFYNKIGFRFNRKQERIYEYSPVDNTRGHATDIIPFSKQILQRILKKNKISHFIEFTGEHKNKQHFSRNKLLRLKENLNKNHPSELIEFFENTKDNIKWVQISNIIESRNETYDFSLDEIESDPWCHSVLYNGIVGHQTPQGLNHFFNIWTEAEKGKNSFVPFRVPWNVAGRDEEWARERIAEIGEITFLQEYKAEFIGSQSTLIDHTFLSKLIKTTRDPLILPKLPKFCSIWQLPISAAELETKNWEYVASLDSAMGLHKDSTVLQICLVKSNINIIQVAKMVSNKIDIESFCEASMGLLKAYHIPRLIIEQNGPGDAAINFFQYKKEYENLIHFDPHGKRLGLISSNPLKRFAVIGFKSYVQKKLLKIYDQETVTELLSFGKKGANQWEGLGGNHDDHVMSLIWIIYYVCSPLFYGNISDKEITSLPDDSSILLTEDVLNDELITQSNLHNPHFHKELLSNASIYGTVESEIEDTNEKGEDDGGGSAPGVFFRKGTN